ncbi:hypothetical protein [Streptomyces reniochalinae]|uniref:Uncharacterized protein n=1 Tax=Streptomyces reniochalinae TaxID=2250578 RepID=A0A367EFD0_9ACTN|nr:hypothetical protein [Streptomyces reniochalinae]RCG16469.1 hypothetical protein DQ392_20190 [Streptomyces reniochalinae]
MDIDAALTLATTAASVAAGSAAGAAGQSAWESLLALARRVGGRRPDGAPAPDEGGLAAVDPSDEAQVRVLTSWLGEQARADEEFAALLRGWAERHAPVLRAERSEVHNTVSGTAQVSGPVIQARDIHGGINLG